MTRDQRPVDVQLSEHDIVQPDLVIVTKPHFHMTMTGTECNSTKRR